ncbi:MAG: ribulose-phosphate 3-epimerase [Eubacteriales bacterium]|nr:ribulose-phosphate 3-epimerase [Eubacteriales bacterium]
MEEKAIILSPSLLSCDFARAGEQLMTLENAGLRYLHLDVMDGVFVPNISFGVPVIKSIRKSTRLIFDTHLMIESPERYIDDFIAAGSDFVTVHAEATKKPAAVLKAIRAKGAKAGISLKPGTGAAEIFDLLPLCDIVLVMTVEPGFGGQSFMEAMLPKIKAIRNELDRIGSGAFLSADGGIDVKTAPLAAGAGVDMLVAGSAVFGKPDMARAAADILQAAVI